MDMSDNLPEHLHLQIELTSHCTLRCRTCVRCHFAEQWHDVHLSEQALAATLGVAEQCTSVHLQGWGESLLRADCADIVGRFKEAGCYVSLSSNGSCMDRQIAEDLIAAGLDSMAFSFAGAREQQHDALRGRGSFERTLKSIATFTRHRKNNTPPLAINYLLCHQNMIDLPAMVRLCAQLDVDMLVATHMVHICSDEQQALAIYTGNKRYRLTILHANALALLSGVHLRLPPLKMNELPSCAKDPLHNIYIAADGAVSPCVNLCPPISPNDATSDETSPLPQRYTVGNLHHASLEEIWNDCDYKNFRLTFQKRNDLYNRLMTPVSPSFEGMERLLSAQQHFRQHIKNIPPPEPCRACPRLFGM